MKKTLLVIERIVLESLEGRPRKLVELEEQTGLNESLLKAILHQLIERGMVKYSHLNFELNWDNKRNWLPIVKNQEGIKAEINELFSSMVNKSFENLEKPALKMKKVWLEPREQEEFERKLRDIDYFLEGIQTKRKTRPVRELTHGKKVIFYGSCAYKDLVDDMIHAS